MAWVRLDDQFFYHAKVTELSDPACLLYLVAIAHSNAALTDGVLTPARLHICAAARGLAEEQQLAAELVAAGLWERVRGGWCIHDYGRYQPTSEAIKKKRLAANRRQAERRERLRGVMSPGEAGSADLSAEVIGIAPDYVQSHAVTHDEQPRDERSVSAFPNPNPNPNPPLVNAPLPPTPLVSVQADAREPDLAGTLTLEPTATSPPASWVAANGEGRGVGERGASLDTERIRRSGGPATPDALPPPGGPVPAHGVPLRAVPKPSELERAATEAHPLYEPLVAALGRPPARDLPTWRDDLAALDEMGATPEDIPRAVAGYAQTMGCDATGRPILLTRAALVRHWYRCLDAPDGDVSRVTGGYAPHEAPIVAWSRRQGYAP